MWNVFDRAEYRAAFFVCVLTAPICILATILRFVTTKRTSRKLGLEDWFALLALLPYLTYTVMLLWSKHGQAWLLLSRVEGSLLTEGPLSSHHQHARQECL